MSLKKSSMALKKVLKVLENPKASPQFVCRLLWLLGYEKSRVVRDIAGLDVPGCSVAVWLGMNVPEAAVFLHAANMQEYQTALREYRIAWVKSMLVAYLAKGD